MEISELKPAEYNPRKITEEKLELLKESLEEFGDLSGIVFNKLTGNLICGHQRLKYMPRDCVINKKELETKSITGTVSEGTISVAGENYKYREVEWDLSREKKANIAANKHGGDWDEEKLKKVMQELAKEGSNVDDLVITGYDPGEIIELLKTEDEQVKIDGIKESIVKDFEVREATITKEVIGFLLPKVIIQEIHKYIEYITSGAAIIKKFPSVEIDFGIFMNKNNLPVSRGITEDEAFYCFITLSYLHFLKTSSINNTNIYNMKLVGTLEQINYIYCTLQKSMKGKPINRNAYMSEICKILKEKEKENDN